MTCQSVSKSVIIILLPGSCLDYFFAGCPSNLSEVLVKSCMAFVFERFHQRGTHFQAVFFPAHLTLWFAAFCYQKYLECRIGLGYNFWERLESYASKHYAITTSHEPY